MLANLNLHRGVRETYRQAMVQRMTQQAAFDRAVQLILEQEPEADPRRARRFVALMVANEP